MAKSVTAYEWYALGPVPEKPIDFSDTAKLGEMVRSYEQILRRIVADADDEEKLYKHRCSKNSPVQADAYAMGTHETHQKIRTMAAHALKEFHS